MLKFLKDAAKHLLELKKKKQTKTQHSPRPKINTHTKKSVSFL